MQTTQNKLLKTAEHLLWAQGYDGASVNDIVRKAGMSKGAFFHYYPNKQSITVEALEVYAEEHLLGPLEKHLSSAHNVKAGLLSWLEESFGAYAQWEFKGGCMLGNFALELSDKNDELREHMKQMFLSWENLFVTHLRGAADEGKLFMEPRQFARLLISMYQGITMTVKVHKDTNRAARDFQALAELIERMIKD